MRSEILPEESKITNEKIKKKMNLFLLQGWSQDTCLQDFFVNMKRALYINKEVLKNEKYPNGNKKKNVYSHFCTQLKLKISKCLKQHQYVYTPSKMHYSKKCLFPILIMVYESWSMYKGGQNENTSL